MDLAYWLGGAVALTWAGVAVATRLASANGDLEPEARPETPGGWDDVTLASADDEPTIVQPRPAWDEESGMWPAAAKLGKDRGGIG